MNTEEKQKLKEALKPILSKKKEEALNLLGKNLQHIKDVLKELEKEEKSNV